TYGTLPNDITKGRNITSFIRGEFGGSQIQLNVLAIDTDLLDKDDKAIEQKFKAGVEHEDVGGNYIQIGSGKKDEKALRIKLSKALSRPRFFLRDTDGRVPKVDSLDEDGGADIGRISTDETRWLPGLEPKEYIVWVKTNQFFKTPDQRIELRGG